MDTYVRKEGTFQINNLNSYFKNLQEQNKQKERNNKEDKSMKSKT